MRIAAAEVIPYSLPFRELYVTARGRLTAREMVLLRIRDPDGAEGLGEAVPLSLRGGDTLAEITSELGRWAEAPGPDAAGLSAPAACAVSTALLDLSARREGVPLWQALGAESADPVRCNATLTAGEPQAVAAQAERWAGHGFTTFKLKVGVPKDADQVAAVRRSLGRQARLRVDANGSWGPAEAVSKLVLMGAEDLELAEQPCETLESLAEVARRVEVPIAADESVTDPESAAAAAPVCAMATVKLSKVGGPEAALEIARRLPVYLSSALDGPVGIAAAAHVAQALGDGDAGVAHGLATQRLFAESIAAAGCELRGDLLQLPDGPGLGVQLDDALLERHRL